MATKASQAKPTKTTASDKTITRSQLLRMPKKDYMNLEQLKFFSVLLATLREETLERIAQVEDELRHPESEIDPLDRAALEDRRQLQLRIVDRELKLVKKIHQAVDRINDRSYGWCAQTGEAIGLERLLLRPTATLSIDAKEIAEDKERHFADEE